MAIKSPACERDFQYMDGLVSTGNQISLHNIKNNFLYLNNFSNIFYSHFFLNCGKGNLSRWFYEPVFMNHSFMNHYSTIPMNFLKRLKH